MAVSNAERERIARLDVPEAPAIRAAILRYIAETDMGIPEFAGKIGYARVAVQKFLNGSYGKLASTDLYLRSAAWEFIQANPIEPEGPHRGGQLFHTENYRRIRRYFVAAVERGEVCLVYGPPGTQKTFALEHLIAERNRAKKYDTFYVYASASIRPFALLKRIARAARAVLTHGSSDQLLNGLVRHFRRLERCAVVVDEAQHMPVDSLEVLRELHDRSGCGLVLAGSHTLYENFRRGREHLEQWLSRTDHRDPLPGLLPEEVMQIAERDLGKLSESKKKNLIAACTVEDVFARDANNRQTTRKYLSVRRLVKILVGRNQEAAA